MHPMCVVLYVYTSRYGILCGICTVVQRGRGGIKTIYRFFVLCKRCVCGLTTLCLHCVCRYFQRRLSTLLKRCGRTPGVKVTMMALSFVTPYMNTCTASLHFSFQSACCYIRVQCGVTLISFFPLMWWH